MAKVPEYLIRATEKMRLEQLIREQGFDLPPRVISLIVEELADLRIQIITESEAAAILGDPS